IRATSESGPIHLIGHSTGGLDARLFVTPNAALKIDAEALEALSSRVQSVVTVATPNHGAPVAAFFSSAMGAQLLRLISLTTIYTMEYGKLPVSVAIEAGRVITRLDDYFGLESSILDQFYEQVFDRFDKDRQAKVKRYVESISGDTAALGQLTPGGIDLLNAATEDRPGVRYGCVVMKARTPGWQTLRAIGFDPYRLASHSVYRFLRWAGTDENAQYPTPTPQQARLLVDQYEEVPGPLDTDGVVPTLSQLWGELVYAAVGDHLDVCGHFNDLAHDPPHYDWIATGSDFKRPEFESLWGSVSEFILHPHVTSALAEEHPMTGNSGA
ncbi:MAG: triacylglycerol lipase, partial [Myxococcota bacterium]